LDICTEITGYTGVNLNCERKLQRMKRIVVSENIVSFQFLDKYEIWDKCVRFETGENLYEFNGF